MRGKLLSRFRRAWEEKRPALIISGPIGAGKTLASLALAAHLKKEGLTIGGVVSPRVIRNGETVGYRVKDLRTGKELLLCAREPFPGAFPFRRFFFSQKALDFANLVLREAAKEAEVIVVDEVGPLELSGRGFALGLWAARESSAFLILTVRPSLLSEVERWLKLENGSVVFLLGGDP
ncbi:MAG: nucleoside-triphosphatase [Candidatus Bipolaricaulaceae bacterium]